MSNLVQKSITDKNGVTSRRWVRADNATATAQNLPAPGVKKSAKVEPLPTPHLDALHKGGPLGHTLIGIESFDQDAVRSVEQLLERASDTSSTMYFQASKAVKDAFKAISDEAFSTNFDQYEDDEDDEELLYAPFHNIAIFGDVIFHEEASLPDVPMLVGGLYQFPLITDFLLEADENEVRQARALLSVTSRLREPFTTTEYGEDRILSAYDDDPSPFSDRTFLTSNDLSELIMSRPDDAEEIARLINERDTTDVDALRDILDHGTQSLREGVL